MLYYYLLFFFIAVGAKFGLALLMIYFLLPNDRCCGECNQETLLMAGDRLARLATGLLPGRLERRWCPGCNREGFARAASRQQRSPAPRPAPHTPTRP